MTIEKLIFISIELSIIAYFIKCAVVKIKKFIKYFKEN